MNIAIFGDGRLGSEVGALLGSRSGIRPTILGRPVSGAHPLAPLTGVDLVFDASVGPAVRQNLESALAAGIRRFVIATTAWTTDEAAVETALRRAGAAAVAAPNFSVAVNLFFRLVDAAVGLYGPMGSFDPYLFEWHHAAKADRPSGTARELLRRIVAGHPRKHGARDPAATGPADPGLVDVAVLRAGAGPGMHLVGFDAPGETLELRLTARDRSAYAAGALVAGDWLLARPRTAGLHGFDEVVDDLLASPQSIARSA